ncbi:MAG: hypothetical protein WCI94_15950 [Rhodospirillales bacterium]
MLGRTLAGMSLVLHDFEGAKRIDTLDRDIIFDDLRTVDTPARQLVWLSLQTLSRFDRILLARDKHTGRCEGAMLVQKSSVGDTPFLTVEAIGSGAVQRQEAMLKRMLAYLILRSATSDPRPAAILAHTRNPLLCHAMRDTAGRIGNTGFYPQPSGSPIAIGTAGLAHRMARRIGSGCQFGDARMALHAGSGERMPEGPLLAMLDFRHANEAALEADAGRLFRDRLPRSAARRPFVTVVPMAKHPVPGIAAHIAAQALLGGKVFPMFRR